MSKHHKHISLVISSVLIVALMSSFYLMSSFGATSVTSFGVARANTLEDYVRTFLSADRVDFAYFGENKECMETAKKELSNLLLLEPKRIEKYEVPGKQGFSHLIYTGTYDVGEIKIKKDNKGMVEILTSEEKLVFAKYADQKRVIGMNMSLKGDLEEKSFLIKEGTLNSDGMKCDFK
jgi:hypothetical protein